MGPAAYASETDYQVRRALFQFLADLVLRHGDVVPWSALREGLEFQGNHIQVIGIPGIMTPTLLKGLPISIRSTPKIEGQTQRYDDEQDEDGHLLYSYLIRDPKHPERDLHHAHNVGLRNAISTQVPLAYFYGVREGAYIPEWPVFVVGDDQRSFKFKVLIGDRVQLGGAAAVYDDLVAEKRYSTARVLQRDHQRAFSEKVFDAYRESCAVCTLRHRVLLDAAHILPDKDPRSEPRVSHGMTLCKLHHAAYDQRLIGITPDYEIEVRADLLREPDGPMLEHGLKGFHEKALRLPTNKLLQPNREHLRDRYELFRRAG